MLENDTQLANTLYKLQLLEEHIAESLKDPISPERDLSIRSLESLARQLKEEIVRYRSAKKLKNTG